MADSLQIKRVIIYCCYVVLGRESLALRIAIMIAIQRSSVTHVSRKSRNRCTSTIYSLSKLYASILGARVFAVASHRYLY